MSDNRHLACSIPRNITQQIAFGLSQYNPGTLSETIPADWQPFAPRRICVSKGLRVTEIRLNGEILVTGEDLEGYKTREWVDDDDRRWDGDEFQALIVEGSFDIDVLFPLLHPGDKIEVDVDGGDGAGVAGVVFGTTHTYDSEVQDYELTFESDRSLEPGESIEIRRDVYNLARIERFWVNAHASKHISIEQICVGTLNQLAGDCNATILASCKVMMDTLRAGVVAMVKVKNLDSMPRRFKGKMIGKVHKCEISDSTSTGSTTEVSK